MARYGQNAIEEVRSRADIVEIIGAHVRLRRTGRNFTGLCPFHDEKTPSFSVSAERGFFHCFGCGAGGTVFDFVMRIEGLTFPEALQSLARRCGVTLPAPEGGPGDIAAVGERDKLIAANQVAADFYAHVLWNTPDGSLGREYLTSRGITVETARAFMLGWAPARPANLAGALHKRGITDAGLKLGLLKRDADAATARDLFRARLMFPIRDAQGRVIAFGGRVLDDRLPKYINSPESPLYSKARNVYGLSEARQAIAKADRAIIVEGYFDVIALWQAGFKETVASLGTALTVEQLRLLGRYTKNLVACFDGDAAGRKASIRALEVFLEAGLLGRGAFIPPGFDPDTLVRERGAQAVNEIVESSKLLIDYFFEEEQGRVYGPSGSAHLLPDVAQRIAQKLKLISDKLQFDLLVRKAVSLLGFGPTEERTLRDIGRTPLHGRAQPGSNVGAVNTRLGVAPNGAAQAELGLLALALRWPDLRPRIGAHIRSVQGGRLRPLIEQVCASDEPPASLEIVVMERLAEDERAQMSALMVGPLISDASKSLQLTEDYLTALDAQQRRSQVAELRRAAANATGDEAAAKAQAVITLRRASRRP